jgi:class 3 adenylate cyclase/tetratricopeptide (TPR) repeat protein
MAVELPNPLDLRRKLSRKDFISLNKMSMTSCERFFSRGVPLKLQKRIFTLPALAALLVTVFSGPGHAQDTLEELQSKLAEEVHKGSCISTLPLARQIYNLDSKNILALQTIAECTKNNQNLNQYASQTKEIFEQSRILSIVPKLLDMAQVKELIPILREVEVKKDKSISDYLMISEIYERLGDPEKQIANLKAAIQAEPNDPRPLLILASKQFDSGQREEAENLFKVYLDKATSHPGRIYLMAYVLALLYPLSLSVTLVGLIWVLAFWMGYRRIEAFNDWHEAKLGMPIFMLIVPPILGFRFWQTGKALPIGALLLLLGLEAFVLCKPWLSKIYGPFFKMLGKVFYFVLNGTLLAKKLDSLSTGSRVLISFLALSVLGTIAPTIENPDLKYGLLAFSSLILYATIGSLMVTFLQSRRSLVVSLRWIGISATFPFLISYLVANWDSLGAPLMYGRFPSPKVIDSLASYLIFWGVSMFLALHLGKIIAQAFIQPISEIIHKVSLIEKGQFDAKVKVFSKDEIGLLGHAINRMGVGLERREKVEKTFRQYVDPKIAERILDGDDSEVRIEGQNMEAVVLFADIRGFTSLSEKTPPQEIVKLLNQFFERMVRIVQDHQGVIDKFIGDNMMAVWGVPHPVADAEKKALQASLAMLAEVEKWREELKTQGYPEIGIGIGLNTGIVVAGSIGSSDHMEYTVIGDVVNTAQRAESIAQKQQLIVTANMYQKIKDQVIATPLEPLKIKGKEDPQHWWSISGLHESQRRAS